MPGVVGIYYEIAARGACSRSIPELITDLEIDPALPLLAAITQLRVSLQQHGLRLIPPLEAGAVETVRTICLLGAPEDLAVAVPADLAKGECPTREFKSSLHFDLRRSREDPGHAAETYRSAAVLHATLKTIAAFINTSGGTLYIGVDDNGAILGLQQSDYLIERTTNRDRFELYLREAIGRHFHEGPMVGAFVRVQFHVIDGLDLARVDVTPRLGRLSCLAKPDAPAPRLFTIYRRDGNRTIEVPIEHLEEFIDTRRVRV